MATIDPSRPPVMPVNTIEVADVDTTVATP
jgi:hypothetical protein